MKPTDLIYEAASKKGATLTEAQFAKAVETLESSIADHAERVAALQAAQEGKK